MTAAAEQTTDEELRLHVPDGYKWALIGAALTKRTLQSPGLRAGDRLALLERLNGMTDAYFTADMLAAIEPMCDTGYAIYKEANSLNPPQDETHGEASFKLLASPKVFGHFCALTPSIMAAIRNRVVAPPPAVPFVETPSPRPPAAMGAAQFAHMQRRSNGTQPAQHRSHHPADQINRMGGGLPDWTYDSEKDNA